MTRIALRGLLSRKLRTSLTALAVVLGIAMVAGTYVLTDTINKSFNTLMASARAGTSAVISGKSLVSGRLDQRPAHRSRLAARASRRGSRRAARLRRRRDRVGAHDRCEGKHGRPGRTARARLRP